MFKCVLQALFWVPFIDSGCNQARIEMIRDASGLSITVEDEEIFS